MAEASTTSEPEPFDELACKVGIKPPYGVLAVKPTVGKDGKITFEFRDHFPPETDIVELTEGLEWKGKPVKMADVIRTYMFLHLMEQLDEGELKRIAKVINPKAYKDLFEKDNSSIYG